MIDIRKFFRSYNSPFPKSKDTLWYFYAYVAREILRVKKAKDKVEKNKQTAKSLGIRFKSTESNDDTEFHLFTSQEEICEAVREEFADVFKKINDKAEAKNELKKKGKKDKNEKKEKKEKREITFDQSSLSRNINFITTQDILFRGDLYTFRKEKGYYAIREKPKMTDELYDIEPYFAKPTVHTISAYNYAFVIKEVESYDKIKKALIDSFTAETFYSIILNDHTMIIMIDKTSNMKDDAKSVIENYFLEHAKWKAEKEKEEKRKKIEAKKRLKITDIVS